MKPPFAGRVCFVGPMVGRHPGRITTQGEILSGLFANTGCSVLAVSNKRNRYLRLLDTAWTLFRRRRDFDLQHLSIYSGPSFVVQDVASWISRRCGHRIVMHLHGGALPEFCARHPRWIKRVLGRADAIVAPSRFLAHFIGSYGFTVQVIPNVLALSDYPYRPRVNVAPRLFWMRSFHPLWNPLMALHVLQHVRETLPEATLVMAGADKGLLGATKQLARQLGLADAVRFPGFLDPAGKQREAGAADIFINTNRIDNTPVAVLEACAFGLPVVSTNVGGIPELLADGETGLLVRDEDVDGMAAAILRLVREPVLTAQLSANGRRLAEGCAWESVRPRWESVFAAALAKPSRA